MIKFYGTVILLSCFFIIDSTVFAQLAYDYPIQPVDFTRVKVEDKFWAPKIKVNEEVEQERLDEEIKHLIENHDNNDNNTGSKLELDLENKIEEENKNKANLNVNENNDNALNNVSLNIIKIEISNTKDYNFIDPIKGQDKINIELISNYYKSEFVSIY